MTLAPIRGAPPGASIPDFPVEEPMAEPPLTTATATADDERQMPAARQPYASIEIPDGRFTLVFKVIPEQPAISRASLTIHVHARVEEDVSHSVGHLKMSARGARMFLTELRNRRSPIIARGDEDGSVEIECEYAGSQHIFSVRAPGQRHDTCRVVSGIESDIEVLANHLLADLGV
jgi:hypothetical protein